MPTKHTKKHKRAKPFFRAAFVFPCLVSWPFVCFVGKNKKFNDHPFPYRTEIELEIATLTNLGVGLGRVVLPSGQPKAPETDGTAEIENRESKIQNSSGWVVMVPFTLPGEKVRARVYRNHKNFSEADLLEVLTPSPHRIAPRCALFGRCGGCQYQHLTYAEQLKWKRQQVEELLKYMAGVEFAVAPVIGSPRDKTVRIGLLCMRPNIAFTIWNATEMPA